MLSALEGVYGSFGKADEERGWCLAERDKSLDRLVQAATEWCVEREDLGIGGGRGIGDYILGELFQRSVDENQTVLSEVLGPP